MKIRPLLFVLTLILSSCENSDLTIVNNSDKEVTYILSRKREFSGVELIKVIKLGGDTIYNPKHGIIKANEKAKVNSPFGSDRNSWIKGINEYCQDSTLTIYFLPTDNWILKDVIRDLKWETKEEIKIKVKDLEKTNWTVVFNESTINTLDGFWTDGSGPNATITIQGDMIRDVEHNTRTKFLMHGDSVTFLDPDPKEVYSAKMYLIHDDTLVYEFSGVKTKYWRFKD